MKGPGKDLLIDAPQLLSQQRRLTDTVVTAVMWILYSYLWAPFISLMAWLLGFEFAYDVMVRAGGASELLAILGIYAIVLACICLVVTAWSRINQYRFAENARRQEGPVVEDREIAEHFALEEGELQKMRGSHIAVVSISPEGAIEHVKIVEELRE